MSQEDIRQLLLDTGGEATSEELFELAKREFPGRSLHQYITRRLQSMEKKQLVESTDNGTTWRLTDRGYETSANYPISELDSITDSQELADEGFSIANIVASTHLDRPFDLSALCEDLPNTEYHPETSPNLIYRPDGNGNVCIMVPSSGRISITGTKSREKLTNGLRELVSELENIGIDVKIQESDILIQNVVANYDFGREFDLSVVAVNLGLDNVEYEPEQFPGLIYRPRSGYCTALLFNSGKLVITGASTYLELIKTRDELSRELSDVGVTIPNGTSRR
jgi:transcription initiation factor TFIID TATA-box-binding protein